MTTRVLQASISVGLVLSLSVFAMGVTTFGFGGEWSADKVVVSVSSDPILLPWTALGVLGFCVIMRRRGAPRVVGVPGWGRRVAALFVDRYFATLILENIAALILLALEARRTGQFAWSFERHYAVNTDYFVGVPIELLSMALLFLYFALPLMRGKQTVGCFVLRITIPPLPGGNHYRLREAAKCMWTEGLALVSWPLTLLPRHNSGPRSATVLVEYP